MKPIKTEIGIKLRKLKIQRKSLMKKVCDFEKKPTDQILVNEFKTYGFNKGILDNVNSTIEWLEDLIIYFE